MSLVVKDEWSGIEVNIDQDKFDPDKVSVSIFGATPNEVQLVIWDLEEQYNRVEFTLPALCADNRWVATGRVWNEDWK